MNRASPFELALVSPVFNEQAVLASRARLIAEQMDSLVGDGRWLHIFVDNGSRDGTPEILREIVENRPQDRFIRTENPDFGDALRTGLLAADTPWAYVLPIDEWDFQFVAWAWKNRHEYDMLLGSKRADPTINQQFFYRRFLSWGLNACLQLLFEYSGTDTHGGKLIRQDALRPIIENAVLRRGQFDTEIVLKSFRAGLALAEAPAAYAEVRPPRNLMITKILRNVIDLWRLRGVLQSVPYQGMIRYRRFSRVDVIKASADIG